MKKLICLVLAVMLALSMVSALAAEYKDKATVKKVQQALNDAGYNCGTPDGSAGKKTKAAIKDYQSANGLNATGAIDDELLAALGIETEAPAEAPAEAQTEETKEEYTFQGIPWGSTPEETIDVLVENGLLDKDYYLKVVTNGAFWMPNPDTPKDDEAWNPVTWTPFANNNEGTGGYVWIGKDDVKKTIGGSEIGSIALGYLYGVEDGQITDALFLNTVFIEFPVVEGLFNEIADQLDSAYGKHDKKEKLGFFGFSGNTYIWEGGNNTAILLTSITDQTNLCYAKTDAYITAQQILEIIEANKQLMADAGL